MADPSAEDLAKTGATAKQVADIMALLASNTEITADNLKDLGLNGTIATKVLGAISQASKLVVDIFEKANITLKTFYGSLTKVGEVNIDGVAKSLGTVIALTTKFDAFKGLSASSGNAVATIGAGFDQLVGRMGGYGEAIKHLNSLGLGGIVKETYAATKQAFDAASNAQELETAYINLQGAGGALNRVFTEQGKLTLNLQDQIAKYGSQLANTAGITNQNIQVVTAHSVALAKLGFNLDTVVNVGGKTAQGTNILTAAMTLARGSARDTADVLKALSTSYDNLSQVQGQVTDGAQKGLDMFALMSTASEKLGLRFVDTESYLTQVADEFKLVGNNTEGATKILANFTGALESTGLTAKQSVNVIQGMVGALGKLEIGTKALISARSGGPGGLQGAFQVENLLREGKVDKVAEMLQNSFKQQAGGRIYTQKEAGESQQNAAQFLRQRTLLQSSAFGGLAKDDASATRLLEAIAKGPTETAAQLKNVIGGATENVAKRGEELQETQTDILQEINNSMDRASIIAQQSLLEQTRTAFALTGKNASQSEVLKNRDRIKADEIYQGSLAIKPNGVREPVSLADQQRNQNRLAYASGTGAATAAPKAAATFVKSVIEGPVQAAQKVADDTIKDFQKEKQNQNARGRVAAGERAETRGESQLHTSLFRPSQSLQRLQVPVIPQNVRQGTTHAPFDININLRTEEGTDAAVDVPTPRSDVKVTSRIVSSGGISGY